MSLEGKNILITGGAVRLGKHLSLELAKAGANIFLHYGNSTDKAVETVAMINDLGKKAWLLQAYLSNPNQADTLIEKAYSFAPVDMLILNASIFEPVNIKNTDRETWQRHMEINLNAPFFISQAFASKLASDDKGRIITMLDWRALRPGIEHFPYSISKAGLAALTQSMARALAPRITVNGIALGAILPPVDGGNSTDRIIQPVPMKRWANLDELTQTAMFLLDGPEYITGEIIHLDGGRHLV
ncbi:MAG: SDR family NAD(P)-dependent oxidoreductase [Leptolinea sp.]|nr:SDR family NAD(P)-dependent oxidoreductase [Leptolinea sp.]